MLPPPSSRTSPSFCFRDARPSGPAARVRSGSLQAPALISQRFMPQASLISIGAILPKNTEARNEETRVILLVALYTSGRSLWKRIICGPVKRYVISVTARHIIFSRTYMMSSAPCDLSQLFRRPQFFLKAVTFFLCAGILPIWTEGM